MASKKTTTTTPDNNEFALSEKLTKAMKIGTDQEVLKLELFEARALRWNAVDPFFKIRLANECKSSARLSEGSFDNAWNESFVFPLSSDHASKTLLIECINGKDGKLIGKGEFALQELAGSGKGETMERWIKLFGAGSSGPPKRKSQQPAVYVGLQRTTYTLYVRSKLNSSSSSNAASSNAASSSSSSTNTSTPACVATPSSNFDSFRGMVVSMKAFDGEDLAGDEVADDIDDDPDWTPLQRAANQFPVADLESVCKLLKEENDTPDIGYLNDSDQSYLHLVCMAGDLGLVKQLSTGGVESVSATDCNGFTPLHVAVAKGFLDIVSFFINSDEFAPSAERAPLVNLQMYNRTTPLHYAALHGHAKLCALLVGAGARVNHQDKNGATPLMKASFGGHTEVVELLLSADAELDAEDKDKNTAFLLAFAEGHFGVGKLLQDSGAKLQVQNVVGDTPLWGIIKNFSLKGASQAFEALMHSYARSSGGNSPTKLLREEMGKYRFNVLQRCFVHLGAQQCEVVVPFLLKQAGKDASRVVSHRNEDGKTAIFYAVGMRQRTVQLTKMLLEHGACVTDTDTTQNTVLHFAAASPNASPKLIKLLIDAFKKTSTFPSLLHFVNAKNAQGNTPLHIAYAFLNIQTVAKPLQIEFNADSTSIRNNNDNLPFQLAWANIRKVLSPFYPDDEVASTCGGLYLSFVRI